MSEQEIQTVETNGRWRKRAASVHSAASRYGSHVDVDAHMSSTEVRPATAAAVRTDHAETSLLTGESTNLQERASTYT